MAFVLFMFSGFLGFSFAGVQFILGIGGFFDAFQSYGILALGIPVLTLILKEIEGIFFKTPFTRFERLQHAS